MTGLTRFLVALCCSLAAALAGAACPDSGGIGGTGITADGGIGGTGAPAAHELGIIGVIDGFGSICVNGVEVDYDASTPVSANNAAVGANALALGQVVAVRAVGNDSRARATRIEILDAMIGRVQALDRASGVALVGAQRVQLNARTVIAGTTREALSPGAMVRVSGLWRADGVLAATRLERAAAGEAPRLGAQTWPELGASQLIVQGYVRSAGGGRINVGGLEFDSRAWRGAPPRPNQLVRISARVEGNRRVLERGVPVSSPPDSQPQGPGGRDGGERRERSGGEDRSDRGPGSSGSDGGDRSGPSDRSGVSVERVDGNSGPGRVERNAAPARVEPSATPERVERNPGPGRVERNTAPEHVERNAGPDRVAPDRPERPERSGPDRPSRPERPDRSGSGRGG